MGFLIFGRKETPAPVPSPVVPEPAPELVHEEPAVTTEIVKSYVDEMGIIAEDTIIIGDVETKGHLAVAGTVEGNVAVAGNVMLTGVIKGSISCNSIIIDGSQLYTSINASGSVSVKENSSVNGNINCKHISVMGSVFGNIEASGNVGLVKTSIVNGDICAGALAVEPGAKIKGSVMIK